MSFLNTDYRLFKSKVRLQKSLFFFQYLDTYTILHYKETVWRDKLRQFEKKKKKKIASETFGTWIFLYFYNFVAIIYIKYHSKLSKTLNRKASSRNCNSIQLWLIALGISTSPHSQSLFWDQKSAGYFSELLLLLPNRALVVLSWFVFWYPWYCSWYSWLSL